MRRALLTQPTPPPLQASYPIKLDDFEVDNFATKWRGSTAFSRYTNNPINGTFSAYYSYGSHVGGSGAAVNGLWLVPSPALPRGSIFSAIIRNDNSGNYGGIFMHATAAASAAAQAEAGYLAFINGNNLIISYMTAGGSINNLASATVAQSQVRLRVFVNSLSASTNPGLFKADALDPVGTLLGTISATVTSSYDFNGPDVGLAGMYHSKALGNYWYDDLKVEGMST